MDHFLRLYRLIRLHHGHSDVVMVQYPILEILFFPAHHNMRLSCNIPGITE